MVVIGSAEYQLLVNVPALREAFQQAEREAAAGANKVGAAVDAGSSKATAAAAKGAQAQAAAAKTGATAVAAAAKTGADAQIREAERAAAGVAAAAQKAAAAQERAAKQSFSRQAAGGFIQGVTPGLATGVAAGTGILAAKAAADLAGALKDGVAAGVAYNAMLETASAQFKVFIGSAEGADEAVRRLRKNADVTPFNTEEVVRSGAVFAQVAQGNIAKMEKLVELAEQLAAVNPNPAQGGGLEGGTVALREALGGDFTSAKERFNISSSDIQRIKDAGLAGVDLAEALVKAAGGSKELVDALGNTFEGRLSTAESTIDNLRAIATKPIFDQLSAELATFNAVMDKGAPVAERYAAALGKIAAASPSRLLSPGGIGGAIGQAIGEAVSGSSAPDAGPSSPLAAEVVIHPTPDEVRRVQAAYDIMHAAAIKAAQEQADVAKGAADVASDLASQAATNAHESHDSQQAAIEATRDADVAAAQDRKEADLAALDERARASSDYFAGVIADAEAARDADIAAVNARKETALRGLDSQQHQTQQARTTEDRQVEDDRRAAHQGLSDAKAAADAGFEAAGSAIQDRLAASSAALQAAAEGARSAAEAAGKALESQARAALAGIEQTTRAAQAGHDAVVQGIAQEEAADRKRAASAIRGIEDEEQAARSVADEAVRGIDDRIAAENDRHDQASRNLAAEEQQALGIIDDQLKALDAEQQARDRARTDRDLAERLRSARTLIERRDAIRAIADEKERRAFEDQRAALQDQKSSIQEDFAARKQAEDARHADELDNLAAEKQAIQDNLAAQLEGLAQEKQAVQDNLAARLEGLAAEKQAADDALKGVLDRAAVQKQAIQDNLAVQKQGIADNLDATLKGIAAEQAAAQEKAARDQKALAEAKKASDESFAAQERALADQERMEDRAREDKRRAEDDALAAEKQRIEDAAKAEIDGIKATYDGPGGIIPSLRKREQEEARTIARLKKERSAAADDEIKDIQRVAKQRIDDGNKALKARLDQIKREEDRWKEYVKRVLADLELIKAGQRAIAGTGLPPQTPRTGAINPAGPGGIQSRALSTGIRSQLPGAHGDCCCCCCEDATSAPQPTPALSPFAEMPTGNGPAFDNAPTRYVDLGGGQTAIEKYLPTVDGSGGSSWQRVGLVSTGQTPQPASAMYAQGTNYVPNDGLAYLHRGEAVIPAAYNEANPMARMPALRLGPPGGWEGRPGLLTAPGLNGGTRHAQMTVHNIFNGVGPDVVKMVEQANGRAFDQFAAVLDTVQLRAPRRAPRRLRGAQ